MIACVVCGHAVVNHRSVWLGGVYLHERMGCRIRSGCGCVSLIDDDGRIVQEVEL